jgi:two-component system, LytTR family, sensor kinase
MQKTNYLYFLAQLGGWFVYAMLLFLANYADNPSNINLNFLVSILVFTSAGILVTHFMRHIYFKWNWLNLKLTPLIPRLILISALSASFIIFINFVFSLLINDQELKDITLLKILTEIFACSFLVILWNAIYFTYHFFQKSINQEMNNLQLQASQHEIELKNLRSQLNPHFLFNSLNSIRALVDIEPEKSKHAITILSLLLRNSLLLGKKEFVPLKEEIELVKNYLDLEKIRFEERLNILYDIDTTLNDFQLPPFIIQTQVENAIKHGISKITAGGTIIIRAIKDSKSVIIEIINTGCLEKNSEHGIGFENSQQRLSLQYKGKASISLEEKKPNVICRIEIHDLNS